MAPLKGIRGILLSTDDESFSGGGWKNSQERALNLHRCAAAIWLRAQRSVPWNKTETSLIWKHSRASVTDHSPRWWKDHCGASWTDSEWNYPKYILLFSRTMAFHLGCSLESPGERLQLVILQVSWVEFWFNWTEWHLGVCLSESFLLVILHAAKVET